MENGSNYEYKICPRCGALITYHQSDIYWDETGYGYSTKLIDCCECKFPTVLGYEEDSWLKKTTQN